MKAINLVSNLKNISINYKFYRNTVSTWRNNAMFASHTTKIVIYIHLQDQNITVRRLGKHIVNFFLKFIGGVLLYKTATEIFDHFQMTSELHLKV